MFRLSAERPIACAMISIRTKHGNSRLSRLLATAAFPAACRPLVGGLDGGVRRVCLPVLCLTLMSCSTTSDMFSMTEVRPWERGTLAADDMQLINDVMDQSADDHIYFSREGSTGGAVVQGSGCGCN